MKELARKAVRCPDLSHRGGLLEERGPNGELVARHVHGPSVDDLVLSELGGAVYYYHHDHLNSTIAVTDESGNVVEQYRYDVYGQPSFYGPDGAPRAESALGIRFLFTGREWLSVVDAYDYRYRAYRANLGTFLQRDPLGFRSGDIHIYRYCGNCPAGWLDPWGLQATGRPRSSPGQPPLDRGDIPGMIKVILAETAGLYPQLDRNPSGDVYRDIYDRENWNSESYEKLQKARQAIAEVATRNGDVARTEPPGSDRRYEEAKHAAVAAAIALTRGKPETNDEVTRFFIRQEGVGRQRPPDLELRNLRPVRSYGPFINVGGGDVPQGTKTYIEFYSP